MSTSAAYSDPKSIKRLGSSIVDPIVLQQDVDFPDEVKTVTTEVKLHNNDLYRVRSSRFADLFQDELIILEKTISVIRRAPFISTTDTITIKDIGRVVYVNGIIFGRIEVLGKNTAHDLKISGLNRAKALKAKKIIEGLILEDQASLELPDSMQTEAHREMLEGIGVDLHHPLDENKRSK